MLLAIDIGNSNIVIGGIQDDKIVFEARIATDRIKTSDQYGVEIKNILSLFEVPVETVEDVIISSVVPPVFNAVRTGAYKVTGLTPMVVGPGIKTGLNIQMDNPASVGSDLIVAAVAALQVSSWTGPSVPSGRTPSSVCAAVLCTVRRPCWMAWWSAWRPSWASRSLWWPPAVLRSLLCLCASGR